MILNAGLPPFTGFGNVPKGGLQRAQLSDSFSLSLALIDSPPIVSEAEKVTSIEDWSVVGPIRAGQSRLKASKMQKMDRCLRSLRIFAEFEDRQRDT